MKIDEYLTTVEVTSAEVKKVVEVRVHSLHSSPHHNGCALFTVWQGP